MIEDKTKALLILVMITAISIVPFVVGLQIARAFDVPPTVDSHRETARTLEKQVYRFGDSIDKPVTYSDGTVVPSRTFSIEMLNHTTQQWEVIGYANMHGHKVKIDASDIYDISIGSTVRFNPRH